MSKVGNPGLKSLRPAAREILTVMTLAVMLIIASLAAAPRAEAAREIPWKGDMFERVSSGEDIKDVLRSVLAQNGLQAAFRPDVKGEVTFEFRNMPLQAAFNKLIIENGLDYDYDASTKLVTIFSAAKAARVKAFVPLADVSPSEVRKAIKQFDLRGDLSIDDATGLALIEGTQEQVDAMRGLIERMDKAAGERATATIQRQRIAAVAAETKTQQDILQRMLNRDIRVIPLRFANVSPTKKNFQGQVVQIPGIEDSLKKLLGSDEKLREGLSEDLKKELAAIAPVGSRGVFVSADNRTNSVIVRGAPEELDRVQAIVRSLDKPVPMVEIEVIIVKAERGLSNTFGVDLAYERTANNATDPGATFLGVNTGVPSANPQGVTAGLGATTAQAAQPVGIGQTAIGTIAAQEAAAVAINAALQSFVAGYVFRGTSFALQAQIEAFEQENRAQTIASPTIVTLNNVPAKIERVASQFFDVTLGAVATSIEEVNVGLALNITPSVIPKANDSETELIRLNVNARNTSIAAGAFAASTASTSGQEIQTEVIIPSGRTYIMGGLLDDTRSDTEDGVPGLRKIPILGKLFGSTSSTDSLVETIFFITPKVIYPEQILPRDIAERRYLRSRKFGVDEARKEIQSGSSILENRLPYQEEDE